MLKERASGKFLELIPFCFLTLVVMTQLFILQTFIKFFLKPEHFSALFCKCHIRKSSSRGGKRKEEEEWEGESGGRERGGRTRGSSTQCDFPITKHFGSQWPFHRKSKARVSPVFQVRKPWHGEWLSDISFKVNEQLS